MNILLEQMYLFLKMKRQAQFDELWKKKKINGNLKSELFGILYEKKESNKKNLSFNF